MKTPRYLLMAVAAAAALGSTVATHAGESQLAPRTREWVNSLNKVPYSESSADSTKNRPSGNARSWELARAIRATPGSRSSVDLAHAPRPVLLPRDERFESIWRKNALREIQIAIVR